MKKIEILEKLKELLDKKSDFQKNDPSSEISQNWIANISVLLRQTNISIADEFDHLTQFTYIPLSSYTGEPIKNRMVTLIRKSIAELEQETSINDEIILKPGDQYDVYKKINNIITKAQSEVFIVDPYVNTEFFDLYVNKIPPKTKTKMLTQKPSQDLAIIIKKFYKKKNVTFEAKKSNNFHDRALFIDNKECWVIGQSIKDAAVKKPTYLTKLTSFKDMQNLYNSIWNKATKI